MRPKSKWTITLVRPGSGYTVSRVVQGKDSGTVAIRKDDCSAPVEQVTALLPAESVEPMIELQGAEPTIPPMIDILGLKIKHLDLTMLLNGVAKTHPRLVPGIYVVGQVNAVITFSANATASLLCAKVHISQSFPRDQPIGDPINCFNGVLQALSKGMLTPHSDSGPAAELVTQAQIIALKNLGLISTF